LARQRGCRTVGRMRGLADHSRPPRACHANLPPAAGASPSAIAKKRR
jgi:hypothetical protein